MPTAVAFPTGLRGGSPDMPRQSSPPGRLLKEQAHRLLHPRLVVLQPPEVVSALFQHSQAQLPLGVESVPSTTFPFNSSWASRPEANPSSLSLRSPLTPLLSQYQANLSRICRHQPHPGQFAAVYPPQRLSVYSNGGLALSQALLRPAA